MTFHKELTSVWAPVYDVDTAKKLFFEELPEDASQEEVLERARLFSVKKQENFQYACECSWDFEAPDEETFVAELWEQLSTTCGFCFVMDGCDGCPLEFGDRRCFGRAEWYSMEQVTTLEEFQELHLSWCEALGLLSEEPSDGC